MVFINRLEAANTNLVTIMGPSSGVSHDAEPFLNDPVCKVDRLDGQIQVDPGEIFKGVFVPIGHLKVDHIDYATDIADLKNLCGDASQSVLHSR